MRIKPGFAAAAAWLCAVGAQAGVCEQMGSSSIPTVVVSPQDTEQLEGRFALSNGQRVELRSMSQGLVADFGRARPVRLQEVERNEFRSLDGSVRLRFLPDPDKDRIVLSYPVDQDGRFVKVC